MVRHSAREGKVNIFKKKSVFMRSIHLKLLCQIKGNSINNCDFIKFIISVMGDRCCYSPWEPVKRT